MAGIVSGWIGAHVLVVAAAVIYATAVTVVVGVAAAAVLLIVQLAADPTFACVCVSDRIENEPIGLVAGRDAVVGGLIAVVAVPPTPLLRHCTRVKGVAPEAVLDEAVEVANDYGLGSE